MIHNTGVCKQNARLEISDHMSGSMLDKDLLKLVNKHWAAIEHSYGHMKYIIYHFADLGQVLHAIWSQHFGGGAVTKWHARLAQNPR